MLLINAVSAQYQGSSPKESFYKMNDDVNEWTGSGQVGAILGFGIFGIMYLYAIVMIFMDIRKNDKHYTALLEEANTQMSQLGIDRHSAEMKEQLALRLAGKIQDNSADDQLLGEAMKVSPEVYRQYIKN